MERRRKQVVDIVKKPTYPAVAELVAKRRPTLLGVKRLMVEIDKMVKHTESIKQAGDAYSMKDIDRFVREKRIPVVFGKEGPMWGCYQESLVLYEALNAMGMSPRLTRFFVNKGVPHTTVMFRMNGKLYEADPFYGKQLSVVDDFRRKYILEGLKLKRFKFIKPYTYTFKDYKNERKTNKFKAD